MTTEARVIVTAQNRSAATFSQVRRDLDSMARTAERSAKLLNKAFAFGVGYGFSRVLGQIVQQTRDAGQAGDEFGKKIDAIKSSFHNLLAVKGGLPEVNMNLEELANVLKDPSIVAAADKLTGALISGFAKAAKFAGEVLGGIREITKSNTVGGARTKQDVVDALDKQIATTESRLKALQDSGRRSFIKGEPTLGPGANASEIAALTAELNKLRAAQQRVLDYSPSSSRGPGGRSRVRLVPGQESTGKKSTPDFVDPLTRQQRAAADYDKFLKDIVAETDKNVRDFNEKIEDGLNEIPVTGEKAVKELSEFWQEGMRNMQDTLAEFLFDPFKDGLDGMLKGFIDVIRRMVAEAAAARIMDALGFGKNSGGGGGSSGGFLDTIKSLFGFADGGSFKVGGSGGTDSQLVAFRASPNETVTVTKPSQSTGGAGATVVNNYYNFTGTSAEFEQFKRFAVAQDARTLAAYEAARRRNGHPATRY